MSNAVPDDMTLAAAAAADVVSQRDEGKPSHETPGTRTLFLPVCRFVSLEACLAMLANATAARRGTR